MRVAERLHGRILCSVILLIMASLACTVTNRSLDTDLDRQRVPLVLLLAPVNNSIYAENTAVEFYALAQDVESRIGRLEFRVDDVPVAAVPSPTEQGQQVLSGRATWNASGRTKHIVTVEAFSADEFSLGLVDIVIEVVPAPGSAGLVANSPAVNPGGLPMVTGSPGATAVPTASPPPTDRGIVAGPLARVQAASLNLRQGPGTAYPSVGSLAQGDLVEIVGRNAERTWWAVAYGDGVAWVLAELVGPQGDVSAVPLVAAPGQN